MSGRNLMWGGFRSHPDAVVKDEPAIELLGASLMAAGLAAGSILRVPRDVSVGATERTHKHIKKRGKRIRVQLTSKERGRDYVGSESRVEGILRGSDGMSGTEIWVAMGGKTRTPGWLHRLLNRMVLDAKLKKLDLNGKSGRSTRGKRGHDRVFVLVVREAHA